MTILARFAIRRDDFAMDVDLDLPARGVTSLLGPSGCGKTSLLRAIAGLDRYPGATLKVDDETWQDDGRFVPPHQRAIGYVFQEAGLFPHLDVRRNLAYGMKRVPRADRKVSLEQAIALLGIEHLLDRGPGGLSGGERQRVAIARALAVNPRLLLLDEPLAALDETRKQDVLPYIEALHDELEIPVIHVSHATAEVARLADHLVLMEPGRIAATGPIQEMFTRFDLPLSHERDASAIIPAVVAGHDHAFHLTHLDSHGGRFTVVGKDLPPGSAVRLRIAARDVSITLERQSSTSILNIFPATVDEVIPEGEAQVTVRLVMKGIPLLARITRKSAAVLELTPGKQVYAQAKSVALLT